VNRSVSAQGLVRRN